MKRNRRNWLIAFIILVFVHYVWGKSIMRYLFNANDPQQLAFQRIINRWGVEKARIIEKMQRLETAHYTSDQWIVSHTAGMEATEEHFPYGWDSIQDYVDAGYATPFNFSTVMMRDNKTNKLTRYVVFKQRSGAEGFTLFMASLLFDLRKGDYLSWYRTNKPENHAARQRYDKSLIGIQTPIVDALLKS